MYISKIRTVRGYLPFVGIYMLAGVPAALGQAAHISYQGELKKNSEPFDGTAQMKFAIVGDDQTLWSNDDTSTGGSEPTAPVSIIVSGGIFTTRLGAAPMVAIRSDAVEGVVDAVLRVWVNTGEGFEQLSDQPISSSAFALSSEKVRHIATDANGNVGIGTTTPQYPLHVFGTPALESQDVNGDVQIKFRRSDGAGDPDMNLTYWGQQDLDTLALTNDAGAGVHVTTDGNVVIGGFTPTNFAGPARFAVMNGNVGIGTTSPQHPLELASGAHCTSGGVWTNACDRDLKRDFAWVDPCEVLDKVSAMPITWWSYKSEDECIRHIGPVAQDFHAAFGLGGDDAHIGTIDADGVALAAIQGLHAIVREKDAQLSRQQQEIDVLKLRLERIEATISNAARQAK